jgi:tRNA (guanine-N7-)-methyltransferase
VTRPLLFAAGAASPASARPGRPSRWSLAEAGAPAELDRLLPPAPDAGEGEDGPWELEIGFGKGRYLLRRAEESPERRFLGIEMAGRYFGIMIDRARRRGLGNVLGIRGEALYALSAVLPRGFAEVVHVYHPDPWPKARHHKRRLFDPETVDLVLGTLRPGGTLYFATDHLDYGELVVELLESHPDLSVRRLDGPWPDGPRTNYEAKYVEEGRPILRLAVTAAPERTPGLHPAGCRGIVAAVQPPPSPDQDQDGETET